MLNDLEKRKLLIPGWAGVLNAEELAYIKASLKADRVLRGVSWKLGRGHGRLNDEKIEDVAMNGVRE